MQWQKQYPIVNAFEQTIPTESYKPDRSFEFSVNWVYTTQYGTEVFQTVSNAQRQHTCTCTISIANVLRLQIDQQS